MKFHLSKPRRKQAISLTPLIDVVFILLLFFMLTSSFVPWRIVGTPLSVASDSKPVSDKPDIQVLRLKLNDGQVWYDGQAYSITDQTWLSSLVNEHQKGTFAIKADDGVSLQSLLHLADSLKENGAQTVSIANAFASSEVK